MNNFFLNWKTTAFGVGSIVFAVLGAALGKITWPEAVAAIIAGAGLFMAKDADKTGVK